MLVSSFDFSQSIVCPSVTGKYICNSSLKDCKYDICILKKGGWNSNDNYRPVSILPDVSKIFERCIFCLLYNFMLEFLSNSQRVFRKDYSTRQHCLFSMLEKSAVDKEKSFGTLLTPFLRHLTVFLKNFCLLISWLWI